jgi:elongation factor Ts
LIESGGDEEAAVRTLRESGKKLMATRQERATEEGRIAIFTSQDPGVGAMIELQVESAPVTKNEEVIQLADDLAKQLASGPGANTPEELWKQPSPSRKGMTLEEQRDELQNKIREVFRLARIVRIDGPCAGYVHHDAKSGVLLQVENGKTDVARDICMHIVAMKPQATKVEELDPEIVAKERSVLTAAAQQEGKPANIIEKMVDGRMRSFYAECVLEEQPFVKDDKQTVGKVAQEAGMKLVKFVLWRLGGASEGKTVAA